MEDLSRQQPHEPQLPTIRHHDPDNQLPGLLGASKGVVAQLNDRWRVFDDLVHWVLQQREGERWRDRSFCQTKRTLLRCIREYCTVVDISGLHDLADVYGGGPDIVGAPYCKVCGRWRAQPQKGLPAHLFCQEHRRKGTKGKLLERGTYIFNQVLAQQGQSNPLTLTLPTGETFRAWLGPNSGDPFHWGFHCSGQVDDGSSLELPPEKTSPAGPLAEPLSGDEAELEYYEDGCPKLPLVVDNPIPQPATEEQADVQVAG